ncbi:MAG TPA: thioredoxin domain-containing protein [Oligoflexus sp.]|uniref:thioredoxin domain-containing protein n=1 Tax=Oligoflexus sp. TaxID=1971216 RepID=UPI002D5EE7E1|nr:thioredoxin domain-containing protein [Oligoflexus sp.]HYX32183.1 thioredoxin domain-containing protein [Oligoflexus sp.]
MGTHTLNGLPVRGKNPINRSFKARPHQNTQGAHTVNLPALSRFLQLHVFLLLVAGCVTTRPVTTLADFTSAAQSGDLILLDPAVALELLKKPQPTPLLMEFYADWCQPCRDLDKPLQEMARDGKGRYLVAKVDVTGREALMQDFGLPDSFPAFILTTPNQPEPLKKYGTHAAYSLLAWLKDDKRSSVSPLKFSTSEKRTGYKAVLVAGRPGNANFIQELNLVHRLLVERGIKESEIACFSAVPDFVHYHLDKAQFDTLTAFVQTCRPAQREHILATIQASINQNPTDFYLYISSHGAEPVPEEEKADSKRTCNSYAPALVLDQSEYEERCQATQDITPDALAAVMMSAPGTNKHLILQGCYTGGFISSTDDATRNPSALALLPKMMIMTASKADRTSFGCNPGAAMTVFGYAVISSVAGHKMPMSDLPWPEIARKAEQIVVEEEKKFRIPDEKTSHPQFFQNP